MTLLQELQEDYKLYVLALAICLPLGWGIANLSYPQPHQNKASVYELLERLVVAEEHESYRR